MSPIVFGRRPLPGESGRLVLEFWVTPFDYAGPGLRRIRDHSHWVRYREACFDLVGT